MRESLGVGGVMNNHDAYHHDSVHKSYSIIIDESSSLCLCLEREFRRI